MILEFFWYWFPLLLLLVMAVLWTVRQSQLRELRKLVRTFVTARTADKTPRTGEFGVRREDSGFGWHAVHTVSEEREKGSSGESWTLEVTAQVRPHAIRPRLWKLFCTYATNSSFSVTA